MVVNITLFDVDADFDSRSNHIEEEGNDMSLSRPKYPLQWIKNSLTKTKAKRSKKGFSNINHEGAS